MNQKEFDILYYLYQKPNQNSQRQIAAATNHSLGTINNYIKKLTEQGYLKEAELTEAGQAALDEYKIRNAIILAAGMSSRFLPLSLEKPKGLLEVKGETMIERQIRQLNEVGITDITVIVGYMKEKFYFLQDKYGVKIVENREYNVRNNTSSLMLVLDQIQNTYICASDHYFTQNIFTSHSFTTNYTVKMVHGYTTDYSYTLNDKGCFDSFRTYSHDELGLVGPCCFLKKDADIYNAFLKQEYEKPDTWGKLWEEVLIDCITSVEMYPRIFEDGVIYEFDNLEELRMFDKNYINNLDSKIIDNICAALNCTAADVINIEPMKIGLTNVSFKFECNGTDYIYRHPGAETSQFLNRECEAYAENIAKDLGLDETLLAIDPVSGWKLSRFIEGCEYIDPYGAEDQKEAMRMLKVLHDQKIVSQWEFDFIEQSEVYIHLMDSQGLYDFSTFMDTHRQMVELSKKMDQEGFQKVLCHNDTWYWNFLKDKHGKVHLIDWEYAGNTYPAADVADYTISLDFDDEKYLALAEVYEGRKLSEKEVRFYFGNLAIVAWHWFVWAVYKEATGTVIDDLKLWYQKATDALKKTQELYNK